MKILGFLGFDLEKEEIFQRYGLKSESVGSEVRSVCFCLSVFSKTFAIQKGTNKHIINDIGARDSTFKAKIHHFPLTLDTNTNNPRQNFSE
jgi:hypothetical protein